MKKRKARSPLIADIERQHPTVAESLGGGLGAEPLNVRLSDPWSDFLRGADAQDQDKARDPRAKGGVPLLDDMKGILQWE